MTSISIVEEFYNMNGLKNHEGVNVANYSNTIGT